MRRDNTREFHRRLYAGMLEALDILKRNDDQQQGTVRRIRIFECRRSVITKTGEMLAGDMQSDHRCTWHIPRIELDRVGINHLNPADRLVQVEGPETGSVWQPEAPTLITLKMFGNHVCLDCLMVLASDAGR